MDKAIEQKLVELENYAAKTLSASEPAIGDDTDKGDNKIASFKQAMSHLDYDELKKVVGTPPQIDHLH